MNFSNIVYLAQYIALRRVKVKLLYKSINFRYLSLSIVILLLFVLISINAFLIDFLEVHATQILLGLDFNKSKNPSQYVSLTNTTKLDSFNKLLSNGYPYPINKYEGKLEGPAIINNGIVISENFDDDNITFSKWRPNDKINMNIYFDNSSNLVFYDLYGNSSQIPSGFTLNFENYTGQYVSINIGGIIKSPEINQVAMDFYISGNRDHYHLILVNGRLYFEGWSQNVFFKSIPSNSNILIDLRQLIFTINDNFKSLDKIEIVIENQTSIISFPFRLDLGKSTINTPGLILPNNDYYVSGAIFNGEIKRIDKKYVLDNWSVKEILVQDFKVRDNLNYRIESSDWDILDEREINSTNSNSTIMRITSERNVNLFPDLMIEAAMKLDLVESINNIGNNKDFLFILLILLVTTVFVINVKFNKEKPGVKPE